MANGGIGGETTKVGVGQVLVVVGVGQEIAPVVGVSPVAARSIVHEARVVIILSLAKILRGSFGNGFRSGFRVRLGPGLWCSQGSGSQKEQGKGLVLHGESRKDCRAEGKDSM